MQTPPRLLTVTTQWSAKGFLGNRGWRGAGISLDGETSMLTLSGNVGCSVVMLSGNVGFSWSCWVTMLVAAFLCDNVGCWQGGAANVGQPITDY